MYDFKIKALLDGETVNLVFSQSHRLPRRFTPRNDCNCRFTPHNDCNCRFTLCNDCDYCLAHPVIANEVKQSIKLS